MALPLYAGWRISGKALPERLTSYPESAPAFHLPGADALSAFADLLGAEPDAPVADLQPEETGAPFALPAMIPDDVPGEIALSREIDFGNLSGRRAFLSFDMLCGRGRVVLEACPPRFPRPGMPESPAPTIIAPFDNAPLTLDVTPLLDTHRRCRLTLHFDAARPAGVCGAILLRTPGAAMLKNVFIRPDPAGQSMTLQADVLSTRNGDFLLRAQLCPAKAPASPEETPPIREMAIRLTAQEEKTVMLNMEATCSRFHSGTPYDAPGMKIQLFEKPFSQPVGSLPCDSVTLMCGFPGEMAGNYLPLTQVDCKTAPEALLAQLKEMYIHAVSLPAAGTDLFYRLMTRAGIGVRQTACTPNDAKDRLQRYPCVTFDAALSPAQPETGDPILSAWQLCGLTTYARTPSLDMTPAELLREAAGREINACEYTDVLSWLRAVSVRLRAEAIRQGRLSGAYCAPGEWQDSDIAQAIRTALSPLHLSALPLCGAWWTGSRFSASLQAFVPTDLFPAGAALRAEATLEDAQSHVLAEVKAPCPLAGGALGLIEAQLPDTSCVLELTTRLIADGETVEESVLPVYVGERGPLEAAF